MGLKSILAGPFSALDARRVKRWSAHPHVAQRHVFHNLVRRGVHTAFGRDHGLERGISPSQFRERVPIRDYEQLRPWVNRMVAGESDILWPGKPAYLAKTSGTTSGTKFIPITTDSIPNHIGTARAALSQYIHTTGNRAFADGKMIFLQGSPELSETGGIRTGRLSGIVYHHVPAYLLRNRMPSLATNCIEDWEQKVEAICRETLHERMTLISGIPPWVIMYYEKLLEMSGKSTVKEVFPDFSLFVYGGVNFAPYKARLEELVGEAVDSVETYPASEGFIAFQDQPGQEGMLLNVDSGIYYEFVPLSSYHQPERPRLRLEQVETGVDYAVVLSSNAGLWAYDLGDTVRFVSTEPYRLVVSGRVKHFLSAFGEHVIGGEVEGAMREAIEQFGLSVLEFSVAPYMGAHGEETHDEAGADDPPRHEWYIAFDRMPGNLNGLATYLDERMCARNSYYRELIEGRILAPLRIIPLQASAFRDYMRTQGKLGGQNKVPRLANDRKIADALQAHILQV